MTPDPYFIWEYEDKILIKKIEKYCKEYKLNNRKDFQENKLKAIRNMMTSMRYKFKSDIRNQITQVIELENKSCL